MSGGHTFPWWHPIHDAGIPAQQWPPGRVVFETPQRQSKDDEILEELKAIRKLLAELKGEVKT